MNERLRPSEWMDEWSMKKRNFFWVLHFVLSNRKILFVLVCVWCLVAFFAQLLHCFGYDSLNETRDLRLWRWQWRWLCLTARVNKYDFRNVNTQIMDSFNECLNLSMNAVFFWFQFAVTWVFHLIQRLYVFAQSNYKIQSGFRVERYLIFQIK